MTYFFETYGCQMNSAESAALALVCRERGWIAADDGESADLVLLNTCSVRLTAEKRALGRIALYAAVKKKRLERGRPLTLVLAGCMAQRLGKELQAQFPAVDYVMGTAARSLFPLILEAAEKALGPETFPEMAEQAVFSFSPSHMEERQFRSFVPIMHGCDNFCSYCIVPYVRGREVSRDPRLITGEIRLVGERGVREITLLGQNVNSYRWNGGVSGGLDFAGLLRLAAAQAAQSGVRWVRFLSANPRDFSGETIRVMAENPVFCRHLHLCVQHGSNRVLSAMNRGYTRERYLGLIKEIRSAMPGISLSTDILVGFPGETGEDLEQTLELMEEARFLYAYMYHYNPREGTAAYNLPGRISEEVKRERLSRVIALQKKHTAELLKSRIGSRERVLVEGISRKNADELITRTERDEMAVVPGPVSMIGRFAELTLSSLRGNTFRAKELRICPGV
ncbi:MAG: tRNA (N6-isopentenyl adenosine(37)-C2)-methylthiotransferase MiaB [Treponema sp.]|jgi:tRNA-2-methylthio-N6-dimethylallyladenosine synthase|nr:tRNA (N6-isopentenyl adenosine(37)-C2)-methylthiotransferase MiaB [Treponema sp.]